MAARVTRSIPEIAALVAQVWRRVRDGYREGRTPYGFAVLIKDGRKSRIPDDLEQAVIIRMRGLRAQGHSMAQIAAMLNGDGTRPRAAKAWHPDAIARVLRRP